MQDILSDSFVENIDTKILKNNITIQRVILAVLLIYTFFDFTEWYLYLKTLYPVRQTMYVIYASKVRPIISIIVIALSFINCIILITGKKDILESFEKNSAELFNKGYRQMYQAGILVLISYLLSISSIAIRFFLKS